MRLWVTRYDTTNLAIPGDVVVIDTVPGSPTYNTVIQTLPAVTLEPVAVVFSTDGSTATSPASLLPARRWS